MPRAIPSPSLESRIRKARSGDLAAIQAVLNAEDNLDKLAGYPDEALLAALSSPDSEITVLETADGGLAAFLWLTWLTSTRGVKIEEFGAAEPGLGHGGRLFDAVLEDVIARYPDRSVWLAVAGDNARAITFYQRRGFRQTDLRPAVWHRRAGPVADAVIMERESAVPKLTANENAVLALLHGANGPMTAYQLIGRMQRNGGAVAPPTVYRVLKGLEEAGFVHRIESLRAWAEVSSPAPGVVAICDDCGSVRSVEALSLFEGQHHRLAAEGFSEARQTIEVHGRCGDCAEGKA
jgi:Fur family zinc uptake transcriptional regulator